MPLSTNSVFHFTKNIESIKSILASNFRIKYCVEKIESKSGTIEYAVPMVSFCDIPLSQVTSHIDKYGGYGIGLHKRWAKRRGLNPVLYLEKHSTILNDVLIKAKFDGSNNPVVQEFLRYTKNYEGQLIRENHVTQKKYRFHDEREWRFCPKRTDLRDNELIIHNTQYYRDNKQSVNERLHFLGLNFSIKDISYIIVKDDDEILEIIEYFESNYLSDNQNDVKILTSRIITSKQIKSDF